MKNLVFDFVNKLATQFMICIPPCDALLGSKKKEKSAFKFWSRSAASPPGEHTLLGDKLWGHSNFKCSKHGWVITCHDVVSAPYRLNTCTTKRSVNSKILWDLVWIKSLCLCEAWTWGLSIVSVCVVRSAKPALRGVMLWGDFFGCSQPQPAHHKEKMVSLSSGQMGQCVNLPFGLSLEGLSSIYFYLL